MSTRPEWVPEGDARGFTTRVMGGIESLHDGMPGDGTPRIIAPSKRRRELSVDEYVDGVLAKDRGILARAITLVESNAERHRDLAREMLTRLLPHCGRTTRIGITGVPGAGKSSLIEVLGESLCGEGHRVAVLAVDPSSSVSGGSVLGDKTRMEQLSRNRNAFIRPSPTGGALGGVARKSREALIVCEAAGFDVILVETVGVGQSEIMVRSMVDFFMLLQIAGAGDDLQGIKKGVMELCDLIVVTKADGDNVTRAGTARSDYEKILHYLAPATPGWAAPALACSIVSGDGIGTIWETVMRFRDITLASGFFQKRRRAQNMDWVRGMVSEHLLSSFYGRPEVDALMKSLQTEMSEGTLSPTTAADRLISLHQGTA